MNLIMTFMSIMTTTTAMIKNLAADSHTLVKKEKILYGNRCHAYMSRDWD